MDANDIYIKGVNALDTNRVPAVLIGSTAGGTISKVIYYSKVKKFKILVPVGIEKLIPNSVSNVAKEAGIKKINFSMGMPCGLLPIPNSDIVTEIEAIKILSGAVAFPIASGGVDGAEGAVTLVIKGSKSQINLINSIINDLKGTKLPSVEYEN
jgi:hypothetical protein